VPDIDVPDTEPVYVIAADPTVPNRMLPPDTDPLIGTVAPGEERVMLPVSTEPACCQVRVNVPV
jgi:hypothetical protein